MSYKCITDVSYSSYDFRIVRLRYCNGRRKEG